MSVATPLDVHKIIDTRHIMGYSWDMKFRRDNAIKLIEQKGYRLDWLAERLGVQPGTLKWYLNGRRNPSIAVARLMAVILEVPESEILEKPAA